MTTPDLKQSFGTIFLTAGNTQLGSDERAAEFERLFTSAGAPLWKSERPFFDCIRLLAKHVVRAELAARALSPSAIDPDDIANDAAICLIESCHTIKDPQCVRGWLWKVIQRKVATALAQTRSDDTLAKKKPNLSALSAKRWARTRYVAGNSGVRRLRQIRRAVRSLSPPLRAVAELRGVRGLDSPTVAEILGVTPNVVRVRWSRARDALEKSLQVPLRKSA